MTHIFLSNHDTFPNKGLGKKKVSQLEKKSNRDTLWLSNITRLGKKNGVKIESFN